MDIFKRAKGIFIPGKADVPNVLAAFRRDFSYHGGQAELIVAAHTFYRIWINGSFLGIGPAPAPFGRLKADCYDLTGSGLLREENSLAVEVMGYVPREFNYSTHETSVFFGEIREDGEVIAATGDGSWQGGILSSRDFCAEAMSHGRRYPTEMYFLKEDYALWRTGSIPGETGCETVAQESRETWKDGGEKEIPDSLRIVQKRHTAMPDIRQIRDLSLTGVSSVAPAEFDGKKRNWWETEAYLACCGGADIKRPSHSLAGYRDKAFRRELTEYVDESGGRVLAIRGEGEMSALEFALQEPETGLIGLTFETEKEATIDILWNDYLDEEGRVPVKADSTNHLIHLEAAGGHIAFESMEPHFMKYIKIILRTDGVFRLLDLYVRRYRFPDTNAGYFLSSDARLNQIYEASKKTLLTNTLAFFLDSPERERGGWAGDSYWTGRAAAMLISDTTVERSMLYDFLAADYASGLRGSFPTCCCGGEKKDSELMYTWSLFVLLELTDYYRRTRDEALKRDFFGRVETFMEASRSLKNELGVLEDIPGTVFIDWSSSNHKPNTSAVCTAANGLYAMVAERLGEMYGKREYVEEAERIRTVFRRAYEEVNATRYDLFTMYPYLSDSMKVEDGRLVGNKVYSEAAQYYYFWTGLLDRKCAPQLWKSLKEQFGSMPEKYRGGPHLNVGNCGLFFGHMIRLDLLSRFGETQLLEKEMKHLCGYMIDQDPGTFWETLHGCDSRNHGYGAHFGVLVMTGFLGIGIPDRVEKIVRFAPGRGSLQWAKGSVCLEDGRVTVAWHKDENSLTASVSAPKGYHILLEMPDEYCCCEKMTVNGEERNFVRKMTASNTLDVTAKREI